MSSINADIPFQMPHKSDLIARLDQLNKLENDLEQSEETFDQIVEKQREEVNTNSRKIEQVKEKLKYRLGIYGQQPKQTPIDLNEQADETKSGKPGNETETTTEFDIQKRLLGNVVLIGKLQQELCNLHSERLLDLSRAKILNILGIRSWQLLKEEANESGMAFHDYVSTCLDESNSEENPPASTIENLCNHTFINTGNIHGLLEEYASVYGEGAVGQSA